MKKLVFMAILAVSGMMSVSAQLPNGSIAPDFTATDINGVEYNLYDILAEGKSVVIDFSATWCGPCWAYHGTGNLETYYEQAGPDGGDNAMVFYIESDAATGMADLQGNTAGSQGDWISGTNYPIIDDASIGAKYQIGAYPTILMVCPDRKIQDVGRPTPTQLTDLDAVCPSIEIAPEPKFAADYHDGCNSLDVNFSEDSWPRAESWLWDFGDGNTSTEQYPSHTYDIEGEYAVSLTVTNGFGDANLEKTDFINVGLGSPNADENVGPLNKDIGTGRYFEGGHQALIFDAHKDFVLTSVTVFSDLDAERTIVLLDSEANVLATRIVSVPVGEQLVQLDIFVPEGTGYRLGMQSDAYFFRNDGGTAYPYVLEDMVTITESTASTAPLDYYYYFYNWDVREPGCDGIVGVEDEIKEEIKMYPNPVIDYLTIDADLDRDVQIQVLNIIGQRQNLDIQHNGSQVRVDASSLNGGVYLITIGDNTYKFYKQ